MAEATDTQSILYENLADAGCDVDFAEQIIALLNTEQFEEGLAMLLKHRKTILDSCHAEQKKIDCLDYLIYRLKKEKNNN